MIRAIALMIGLALIVVPVSELMFWPVVAESIPGLVGFYGLSVLLAALLVERSGARGWASFVLAGGVFGWLIEGVVVNQTYEAVPFSLVWTPLAWHMTLSVMGAVVTLGWALRRGVGAAVLICAAIGAFAGLWGAYGWTELANDVTSEAAGLAFAPQILIATGMMAVGHMILSRLPNGPVPRWVLLALVGMAVTVWATVWALPLFPASLAVPVLIALSALALHRVGGGENTQGDQAEQVPAVRFLAFGVIPAVAVPVQIAVLDAQWLPELNAFVAIPLVVVGAGAWLLALGVCLWRGRRRNIPTLP